MDLQITPCLKVTSTEEQQSFAKDVNMSTLGKELLRNIAIIIFLAA